MRRMSLVGFATVGLLAVLLQGAAGCAPKVAIEAPTEPIVINMNIVVEHEIRVRVDKDLDELIEAEKELF